VNRASYASSDMWTRFRLRSRALAMATGPRVHLSGWSAASVVWDMPTIGRTPARPQAIRTKGDHRRDIRGESITPFGRVRTVDLSDDHLTRAVGPDGEIATTTAAWTVVDLARLLPVPDGLVLVDRATRNGHDLRAELPSITGWLGAPRARWVVDQAQPNCETPLESIGRVPIYVFDLPHPVFNAWVGIDRPLYRVDELWPWHGVVGEADGAIKYNNRPDANDIVRQQHEREWVLQRLGLRIVRYGWKLAHDHGELGRRFSAVLADQPVREEPIRWWPDDHGTPRAWSAADQPLPGPVGMTLPAGWNRALGRT